ncbi:MAG: substrate-binding domain-containing protein [Bacillus sp. (in: Bacteria)]|nr:substrate-binding domain-containing protein [Bacillus sp. (in: firmicutes)]
MGEGTKKRIKEAIEQLNYHPNFLARSLKQKKSRTIGIIAANILHHYSTQVCRAIEDFCQQHNYHVIICNADDDPKKEKNYIEMLLAKQVDGLIVVPTGENMALYEELVKQDFPLVFMDRKVEGVAVDTVTLKNRIAAMEAVNQFAEYGHRHIAMITLLPKVSVREERIKGYFDGLQGNFLGKSDELLRTAEIVDVQGEFESLMNQDSPPTALLVGNDLVLMEVLRAAKRLGVVLPEQLSIISFDEVSFADFINPPITTIAQPAFEMGKKAAELLLNKVEDDDQVEPADYAYDGILQIRQSVARLREGQR